MPSSFVINIGVDDQVANSPHFVIKQKAADMTDFAIGRMDVIPIHFIATAQVDVVVLMPSGFLRLDVIEFRLPG